MSRYTNRSDFPKKLTDDRTVYCFSCHKNTVVQKLVIIDSIERIGFECSACSAVNARALIWDKKMIQYFDSDGNLVHEGAGIMILNQNKKLLMVKRTKFPFLWTIPGGHMNPAEDPKVAALREINEEIGLTFPDADLIFEGFIKGDECMGGADIHKWYLYTVTTEQNTITLNDEASEISWFSRGEIPTVITFPVAYLLEQHEVQNIFK